MTATAHPALTAQATLDSPLGPLLAAATDKGLAGLWFDDQAHHPGPLNVPVDPEQRWIRAATDELAAYFHGHLGQRFRVPLDLHGTAFQRAVWRALQDIAPGSTSTYGEIAQRVGSPLGSRAAGAAIGRNPVGIIVPCHRVIGRDGSLTGYAGGIERKQALLQLEGVKARIVSRGVAAPAIGDGQEAIFADEASEPL